ncbi:MAG TPA: hypothetical protein VFY87_29570 [Geminicoccaceae bacterium]|nr:hypothetical protein [Geminicoccaceae bacterium]
MVRRWTSCSLALLGCLVGCGPAAGPGMGTPVSGRQFEESIAGQAMSFRLPDGALAEVQFQPDGTAVYRGAAGLDGVGRWRPWGKGYCAYYPRIGGGPALGRLVAGPVAADGYCCYEVRAADGYHALFRPDGVYVGALVPLG